MDSNIATSRIEEARKFLIANPTEKKITAARIFGVNVNSLKAAILRDYSGLSRGPRNQILNEEDTKAIHERIKSHLIHGILPTFEIVFNMIIVLKRARDPTFDRLCQCLSSKHAGSFQTIETSICNFSKFSIV